MQTGKKDGNCLLNDSLTELVKNGLISTDEAVAAAVDKRTLATRLERVRAPAVPPVAPRR